VVVVCVGFFFFFLSVFIRLGFVWMVVAYFIHLFIFLYFSCTSSSVVTDSVSKLSSPYLVKLFGTSLQPLGMVMEFCAFKSLDVHLLSPAGYDWHWDLRLKVAHDIARGLAALHAHSPPIIHRDLRSPNIFV
jgi:hypothetical protein